MIFGGKSNFLYLASTKNFPQFPQNFPQLKISPEPGLQVRGFLDMGV